MNKTLVGSVVAATLCGWCPYAFSQSPSGNRPSHASDVASNNSNTTQLSLAARCSTTAQYVRSLVRDRHFVDAHFSAMAIDALCHGTATPWWRYWGAIALAKLDEQPRAQNILRDLRSLPYPQLRSHVQVAYAWLASDINSPNAHQIISDLPELAQRRLHAYASLHSSDDFVARAGKVFGHKRRTAAIAVYTRWQSRSQRSPVAAGILSAALPGLGQLYAGSLESAGIALALNAILISATVELARRDLYFASGTTGVAASVFYIGNIVAAANLAAKRNERSYLQAREELQRVLLPEISP